MGLAGEKKRMKLSHDPNNTRWTNDNSSFGLKIMTSQGWQPGEYLGAKDAAHAEFHTAANASHIRVSVKDDNLGLGAKIGAGVGHGECTGLDAFKNLLGRLNGKDEDEIVKEQESRDDLRRAIYSERKWGTQRFVSGGFLIGDKIQILIDAEAERIRKLALGESRGSSSDTSSDDSEEEEVAPVEKTKKSKKRKLEVLEETEPQVVAFKVKKSKQKSKKERKTQDIAEEESAPSEDEKAAKKSKKSKKSKKDRRSKTEAGDPEEESDIKQRKKEKKDKKEKKRKEKAGSDDEETEKQKKKREKKERRERKKKAAEEDSSDASEASSLSVKESTPIATPSSIKANPMLQGRHAVRSRYIAQKRLASMDAASLNQIFMIKSQ